MEGRKISWSRNLLLGERWSWAKVWGRVEEWEKRSKNTYVL